MTHVSTIHACNSQELTIHVAACAAIVKQIEYDPVKKQDIFLVHSMIYLIWDGCKFPGFRQPALERCMNTGSQIPERPCGRCCDFGAPHMALEPPSAWRYVV